MKYYEIIEALVEKSTNVNTFFFYNDEDVEKTIGRIICGNVKENSEYIVFSEPLDEIHCDFVTYDYGDYNFGYIMEE